MHKFTAVLSKKAQKQLDKLSDNIAEPILEAIALLEETPRPVGCKKLKAEMDTVLEWVTIALSMKFLIVN